MLDELDDEPRYYAEAQGLHFVVMDRETRIPVLGERFQPVSYRSMQLAQQAAQTKNEGN